MHPVQAPGIPPPSKWRVEVSEGQEGSETNRPCTDPMVIL